jgi:phosphate transport system substrate-binding protein
MEGNVVIRKHHRSLVSAAAALTAAAVLAACGSSSNKSSSTTGGNGSGTGGNVSATLNASGSTFQATLEQNVIAAFKKPYPNVTINYAGGGSGKGKADLASGIVDFAGTDSLLKDTEKAAFKGATVLYFPIAAAPVTISYNLSGVSDLKLSPETIGGIFEAKITTWDDPAIKADNPGVNLPSTKITPVHRAEASGTTSNFTKFLTKAAPNNWTLGSGDTVNWPASEQSGQGNPGVATIVKQTDGAVGYVDFADAKQAGLSFASVKNSNGEFIAPSLDGSSKALAGSTIAADLTFSPIDTTGAGVYPITAPTWILVRQKQTDTSKGAALKAYINFMLTTGQTIAPTVNYSPLPSELVQKAIAQLGQLQIG